jgi:hypothetical protein
VNAFFEITLRMRSNIMSEKKDLEPNDREIDIIAGAIIPTKKELKEMREKFKDDKEVLAALEDNETID